MRCVLCAGVDRRQKQRSPEQLPLTLARAENLGLRILQAKADFLQATLDARNRKNSDAALHYRQVVGILDGISKEDGSSKVLDRADLRGIYSEAQKGSR